MTVTQRIIVASTPGKSSTVVAHDADTNPAYVRAVWRRHGIKRPRATLRLTATGVARDLASTISVQVSPDMVQEIRGMADAANVSFSEQVRLLLEWGIEAAHGVTARDRKFEKREGADHE